MICWYDSGTGDYNQEKLVWKAITFVVHILNAPNFKDIILLSDALPIVYKPSKEVDQHSSSILSNMKNIIRNAKDQHVVSDFCYLPRLCNALGCELLNLGLSEESRHVWHPSSKDIKCKIIPQYTILRSVI